LLLPTTPVAAALCLLALMLATFPVISTRQGCRNRPRR
jgi:hypothetical protein